MKTNQEALRSKAQIRGARLAFYRVLCDATNTLIWQKSKLHALEVIFCVWCVRYCVGWVTVAG